jgi:hypothetical protein
MKLTLIMLLVVSPSVFAQGRNAIQYQTAGPVGPIAWDGMMLGNPDGNPVEGAPYSATILGKSVRTLADGSEVVQSTAGAIARDSQGRTRKELPVPLNSPNLPRIVFIHDPVARTSYAVNLTDKTAQKMPEDANTPGAGKRNFVFGAAQVGGAAATSSPGLSSGLMVQSAPETSSPGSTEDLGSQTMDGLIVTGVRTTRTIPAGQIGNAEPITIVTEVWSSPDLKATVYSKRDDPLMGESTFQLNNISRAEPDPSLFIIPIDFKVIDGPEMLIRRANE